MPFDQETAYAKLNLALHVRKRLSNGYHDIETIFAFVDNGDELLVEQSDEISLEISGPFSDGLSGDDNLVTAAARLLARDHGISLGAKLHLIKNLPIASGIGGGSADAAATLRLLNRFWKLDLSLEDLAKLSKPLGADIPACVLSKTCFGEGIGQDLKILGSTMFSEQTVLLVNPLVEIPTSLIFEKWDGKDGGPIDFSNLSKTAINGHNDLQNIAVKIEPKIAEILWLLEKTQPLKNMMSGSGATCFGLYKSVEAAERAEAYIASKMPLAWTMIGDIL